MTGLLRYALLKSARDGSLATMLAAPTVMIVAPTFVMSLLTRDNRLVIPTNAVQGLAVIMAALIASLAGFQLFRTEIADHSIGSLILATRPVTVPLTATVFGAAVGAAAALLTVLALGVLTGSWPASPLEFASRIVIVTIGAASVAILCVALTRSAAAIAWMYATIVFVVLSGLLRMRLAPLVSLGVVAVSISLATIVLERKCAS